MERNRARLALGVAMLAATACADSMGSDGLLSDAALFNAAFSATPAAFSNVESSYGGGSSADGYIGAIAGEMRGPRGQGGPSGGRGTGGRRGHGGHGHGHGPGFGGFMGGGLLHGLDGLHRGGRPGSTDLTGCTLVALRVTCADEIRHGLTISRSYAFATAGGTPQGSIDSTTNSVNARRTVTGTIERRNGATSTIDHTSDRTVTGLAAGSTARTINGTSSGTETTTFTNAEGVTVTLAHVASDAIRNVIVPVSTGTVSYPMSGTVERSMRVTITEGTAGPRTLTRSELLTYDGSATASLVITTNGVSRSCTVALPRGRPVCE